MVRLIQGECYDRIAATLLNIGSIWRPSHAVGMFACCLVSLADTETDANLEIKLGHSISAPIESQFRY